MMLKKFVLCILALPLFNVQLNAQCITAGPNSPTEAVNNTSIGTIAWGSPANVFGSDNARATAGALVIGNVTNYLVVTGFNFAIPSTAIICGITIHTEKGGTGLLQTIDDNSVRIVKNGIITGTDHATPTDWAAPDVTVNYGGNGDLWGTTWTPSEISSAEFGVAIAADLTSLSLLPTAHIDNIRITVHYDNTLPIELLNFEGKSIEDKVILSWTVASQINNDFFTVEKSSDGISFETVGKVDGAVNSDETISYELTDNRAYNGSTYYRLTQTDMNGASFSFNPILIDCSRNEGLTVYPNPSNEKINISFMYSEYENYTLSIFDQSGKSVLELSKLTNGHVTLENHNLENGLYFVQLKRDNEVISSQKLMITN